jgi:hypothetical protein
MFKHRNSTFNRLATGAICNFYTIFGTAGLTLNNAITVGVGMIRSALIATVRFFVITSVGIFIIVIITSRKAEDQHESKQ